jgi:hypothetical protein
LGSRPLYFETTHNNASFTQPSFPILQLFCGYAMQPFDIVACL